MIWGYKGQAKDVLSINLIHRPKILHIRQKHIDLDHILNRRPRGFEDGGQVLDALVLQSRSQKNVTSALTSFLLLYIQSFWLVGLRVEAAYGMSRHIALDDLPGLGVHGDGAGAVDGAIGYDGLGVDAFERGWGVGG